MKVIRLFTILFIIIIFLFGKSIGITISEPINLSEGSLDIEDISYWGYQIQGVNEEGMIDEIISSSYDMMVIEPTRTDIGNYEFDTKNMVDQIKLSKGSNGQNRKMVIAYIDIGEAEDWRWYWNWDYWVEGTDKPENIPKYIISQDPDGWEGNFPVAYWDNDWKDIVIYGENQTNDPKRNYNSILEEVLVDGFDGIYLDWVEAFEDEQVIEVAKKDGVDPASEMIKFIAEMGTYARKSNPNFIIIQQNAAGLIEGHPELLEEIDAISQEAIWFDGDATDNWNSISGRDKRNNEDLSNYYINYLEKYTVPVFNVEYASIYAEEAYELSYDKGYIPYVTHRSLSELSSSSPFDYDSDGFTGYYYAIIFGGIILFVVSILFIKRIKS